MKAFIFLLAFALFQTDSVAVSRNATMFTSTLDRAAIQSSIESKPTAPVVLIITGLEAQPADFAQVAAHALVQKTESVFDDTEKRALQALGKPSLSHALKVTLQNQAEARRLSAWIQSSGLKLRVEEQAVTFSLAERFEGKQWGLRNIGQVESVAIDDLTTVSIQGRIGEDIGATDAPAERPGDILVAVLDTGANYEHPDLDGQLSEKVEECKAYIAFTKCSAETTAAKRKSCQDGYKNVDSDGNGYPLDCSGWNTTIPARAGDEIWGTPDAADENGHGTHVTGIIGAAVNGVGVRGVAAKVKILPVKVITASPSGPVRPQSTGQRSVTTPTPGSGTDLKSSRGFGDLVARGLLYAIRSGAKIANLSLGWPAEVESHLMREMIELAHQKGVLVVAAAGNDATDALVRPCSYNGVICVASHDPDGGISNFSNFGSGVDLAAPGLNILSTWPEAIDTITFTEALGYEIKSGTSMAAPHVTAVLARLLNAGFSSREAYARLMLGARPHQPSRFQGPGRVQAFTLSGNADLARAFKVAPQPLFLPVDKSPIAVNWNRVAHEVSFHLPLKNAWVDGRVVEVEARLIGTSDASLSKSRWTFATWAADETKNLSTSLVIRDKRLESELLIEVRIRASGFSEQIRILQAEVRVPVGPTPADRSLEVLAVDGNSLRDATIRSVTSLDDQGGSDYIAVVARDSQTELRLLKETAGRFKVNGEALIPSSTDELLLIHRVDVDLDGSSDYVFVYRTLVPPPSGSKDKPQRGFQFRFFDSSLRPLSVPFKGTHASVIEFDNKRAVISDNFQWMRLGNRLVPAWVTRGLTPELEKADFDPWNPDPNDPPSYRLYYLAEDGLRSVSAPGEDAYVLARLAMTPEQRQAGRIPVLIGTGLDTKMTYSIAEIIDGKTATSTAIFSDRYRNLRGVEAKEITSLDPLVPAQGTAFSSESFRGAQRVSLVGAERIHEAKVAALSKLDTVTSVAAVFSGANRSAVISQTIYDLQIHDLETNTTAATSLRRFSFLPGFFFFRFFFPVAVGDSQGSERLPAVFVSGGLGISPGVDVIVPRYENGQLQKLVRPAKLRFQPQAGCKEVGNAVPATVNRPSALMFFCGDRFIRAPLEY